MSQFIQLMQQVDDLLDTAAREGRQLTADEHARYDKLVQAAKSVGELENQQRAVKSSFAPDVSPLSDEQRAFFAGHSNWTFDPYGLSSPGARFVQSEGFKRAQSSGRGQTWTTGVIDTGTVPLALKGTLMEAPGSGAGAFVSVPQVIPGVVDKLFQPLTFEALLMGGQATTSSVRYVTQGTAVSGAAGVAEGGLKPESTLGFTTADEPIKKVATSVTLSDEILEDAPAVQQFVNNQLSLFVNIEVERELLRGTQGGNEVQGLLTSRGVPIYAGGTAAGNKAVQLFKAMNGVRGSAFVEPEWVVLSPSDWESIRLLTDTAGQFFGGGPFQGPYGSGQVFSASGQATGAQDSLWNKQVYVTSALGAGTAVIGSRAAAQVWSRGGLRVEATTSHSDNFTHDLVAIRAERRLGLGVLRPNAFCEVRLA
jgi:HK97 family phage major capsid protein